ncbi:hypothetical protein Ddye_028183 [Dipteronia dyeriana]|uniref:AAA+ ATPase domain-containing protein n=1 Tax=Dipteronia dyeriana TaxID=168575 RepID=A0AAD9TRE2_9ROSI|nr:hypothetical protein Ddye_028183 [Dipteronia dyeriana]
MVAKYLVSPVARPFRYLWKYKSNFEKLENEVKKLEGRRDTVQHSVEDARRKGEEIEKHVDSWLDSVKNIIDEASEVVDDNHQQANMQCFKVFSCSYLKKRHQHSKKAAGKSKDVVRLEQEAGEFKKISYRTIPEETWLQSSKGYEAFESRESIMKNIIDALCNPDVNMVGIYGMGGVGKTTLAKEVGKQAVKLFNEIVFAEMSDSPDIKKIQGEIADKLGLEFREETESGRARRLCERLKKEEKILLILDNIWGSIDLEKIGIPSCDNHKGCKLLLTTRSRDVLTNKMDSQINFYIEVLNEDDAWKLFKRTAGICSELPDMQSVALEVAKACAGVPIAIVTVAKALKGKGVSEWNKALRELRRPSPESFEGVTSEVYLSLQLSYNNLETEELKSTFLLCGRMVCIYNVSVQDLLRYGMGLGLFTRIETMEEALDNVDALVSKLKASSLLLDSSNSKIFAMHDVVRDVARSIASRDHHMFTLTDDVTPWNWAYEDKLKNCTAISLHNITKLPKNLVCPQLKFFYMKTDDSFLRIPDNFFTGMLRLQVLHLTRLNLCSLPTSLSQLVNLQTLCLEKCELGDIVVIGDLKKLEILSLRHSNIKKLSRETRQLTRLRLLDLSECSKLSVIPPDVLSSLTKLEALYMGCSFIQWEVEGSNIERSNASLDELKHLCHLTTLEIQIPDVKKYSKGLLTPKLERYKILIGHQWYQHDWNSQYETSRMLKLNLNSEEDGVISQLKGIRELELCEVPGVRNVLYDLDGKGFPELKHLCVKDNSHFSCIVDSKQSVSCGALPILELMFLSHLINLEKICNDSL